MDVIVADCNQRLRDQGSAISCFAVAKTWFLSLTEYFENITLEGLLSFMKIYSYPSSSAEKRLAVIETGCNHLTKKINGLSHAS